jgi:hypothetical protein
MADEPKKTEFTVLLLRLADSRILVQADDSNGRAAPVQIAARKESAVRDRLRRDRSAGEVEAILGALAKGGDKTTVTERWASFEELHRFWNG